jgi:putative PIN family toxin of toxin-antitoxin system
MAKQKILIQLLVVIDTNVLLVSISAKSKYHWLYQLIIQKKIQIAFSNEILMEYEEVISSNWNIDTARSVVRSLIELSSTELTVAYFKLNLIVNDADDNKFVDCAFAANAAYIITNDSDFNILKTVSFPSIKVKSIDVFKELLIQENIINIL